MTCDHRYDGVTCAACQPREVDMSRLRLVARAHGLRRALEARFYLARPRASSPAGREDVEALILAELEAVAIELEAAK